MPSKKTTLNALHHEYAAKMVEFAGYEMPVQYALGVKAEHLHTRSKAGLFDVSHMGQIVLQGEQVIKELEALLPVELEALGVNQQVYALLTNEEGGIRDDCIVTRWGEESFFIVVNAACKNDDLNYFINNLPTTKISLLDDRDLLAIQGPAAQEVVSSLIPEAEKLTFLQGCNAQIEGVDIYISRSGYTGEDGFELSIPSAISESLTRRLLSSDYVELIGLAARDSLRLEAGLCLYGQDLDNHTTPIEASLNWSVSASRRNGGEKAGGFPGAKVILNSMNQGVQRKRVGLLVEGRAPVRQGVQLFNVQNEPVGVVTSGGYAPTLASPVAMGYVKTRDSAIDTQLFAEVRNKKIPVTVVKTPFVQHRYVRG